MSQIQIVGNLADDPEVRRTHTGRDVTTLVVLESRSRRTEAGEWEDDEPNRHRVQVWGPQGEHAAVSLGRGDRVIVLGTVETSRWTDKDTGETRTAAHVTAEHIGPSLQFHTAKPVKAPRKPEGAPGAPGVAQ